MVGMGIVTATVSTWSYKLTNTKTVYLKESGGLAGKKIRDSYLPSCRRTSSILPRFAMGDTIYVADPEAANHTRLPGFLRNKRGTITKIYSDAYGPDGLDGPQHMHFVSFNAF
ncbi:MAG: SH3-like domain-containing protein [Candidatus Nitrosoglobus sp.]